MLGIIVGVAAVIAMISLGEGAKRQIEKNITSLGTNLLYVRPGSMRMGMVRLGLGTVPTVTVDDGEAIRAECPSVVEAAPHISRNAQIKYGDKNWSTYVTGKTPTYESVGNVPDEEGSFLDNAAIRSGRRVAVIGKTVVENLFGSEYPIGKVVRINRVACTVIGMVKTRSGTHWFDPDDTIFLPLSSAPVRLPAK